MIQQVFIFVDIRILLELLMQIKFRSCSPILGGFLLILCFAFYSLHSFEYFALAGRAALVSSIIGIVVVGGIVLFKTRKLPAYLVWLVYFSMAVFFIYALSSYEWRSLFRGLQVVITIAIVLSAFLYGAHSSVLFGRLLFWSSFFSLLVLIVFGSLFFEGARASFQNANSLGLAGYVLLSLIMFSYGGGFWKWILSLLAVWLIVLSGSRASLLAVLMFFITYWAMPLLRKYQAIFVIYLLLLLGGGFFLILFVTGVVAEDWMAYFDALSREYFNKRIESGRNEVWSHVIELIKEKPFWGWGGGVVLSDLSQWDYSVHNLYLQVLLQVGLVGLFGVIFLILILWFGLFSVACDRYGRVAASSFVGLLVVQFFEVSFFQNNLALSLPIMILVGVALGRQNAFLMVANK